MSNEKKEQTVKQSVPKQGVYEQAQRINKGGTEHATVENGKLKVETVLRG